MTTVGVNPHPPSSAGPQPPVGVNPHPPSAPTHPITNCDAFRRSLAGRTRELCACAERLILAGRECGYSREVQRQLTEIAAELGDALRQWPVRPAPDNLLITAPIDLAHVLYLILARTKYVTVAQTVGLPDAGLVARADFFTPLLKYAALEEVHIQFCGTRALETVRPAPDSFYTVFVMTFALWCGVLAPAEGIAYTLIQDAYYRVVKGRKGLFTVVFGSDAPGLSETQ